jgi:hypothetical protein
MSNPTSSFGWIMPTSTDLVTDLPADFEVFGQAVDSDLADLLGGTTGQVLSKTSATDLAFTWIEQDDTTLSFNPQTGITYTLVASDVAKLVTTSNASAVTVTIPASTFAVGNIINIQSIGVGLTTISGGAVTITSTGAVSSAPILRAQFSACSIICTASDVFTILGDLIVMFPILGIIASANAPRDFTVDFLVVAGGAGGSASSAGGGGAGGFPNFGRNIWRRSKC